MWQEWRKDLQENSSCEGKGSEYLQERFAGTLDSGLFNCIFQLAFPADHLYSVCLVSFTSPSYLPPLPKSRQRARERGKEKGASYKHLNPPKLTSEVPPLPGGRASEGCALPGRGTRRALSIPSEDEQTHLRSNQDESKRDEDRIRNQNPMQHFFP